MVDVTFPPPGAAPAFTDVRLPVQPRAIALVLHGGADRSVQPVDGSSLSWRRGRALARAIGPELTSHGIGVVLLRYRVKGWNHPGGGTPDPVQDGRWALEELEREHGLPIALVGHSMGGRTAAALADHPLVRGVVALAPWFQDDDSVQPLAGKMLRAAHGRRDRITSAKATRRFVERAARQGDATFTDMGPVGHYLLRNVGAWNAFAVDGAREILTP